MKDYSQHTRPSPNPSSRGTTGDMGVSELHDAACMGSCDRGPAKLQRAGRVAHTMQINRLKTSLQDPVDKLFASILLLIAKHLPVAFARHHRTQCLMTI